MMVNTMKRKLTRKRKKNKKNIKLNGFYLIFTSMASNHKSLLIDDDVYKFI